MSEGRPKVLFVSYKNRADAQRFLDEVGNNVRVQLEYAKEDLQRLPGASLKNVLAVVVPPFKIGKGRRSFTHLSVCEALCRRQEKPVVIGIGRRQNWSGASDSIVVVKTPTQAARHITDLLEAQKQAAEEAA